jgi:predicted Zn-dependent protease
MRRYILFLLCAACALRAAAESPLDMPLPSQLAFSQEEINAHARQIWAEKLRQESAQGLLGCVRHCEQIERVFSRLRPAADTVAETHEMQWQLAVGTNPREDAWALAGGLVYISEAFIDEFQMSEEALAFVLAHEMGHALLKHENQVLTVALALLPRGVTPSVENIYAQFDFDFGLALKLQPEFQADEFEADRAGMMIGCVAGYDGNEMLGFLEQLAQQADSNANSVLKTHPDAVDRLARARAVKPSAQRLRARLLRLSPQAPG